jgi:hypothetical protein
VILQLELDEPVSFHQTLVQDIQARLIDVAVIGPVSLVRRGLQEIADGMQPRMPAGWLMPRDSKWRMVSLTRFCVTTQGSDAS